ncbi:hypothetical protein BMETH_2571_0 [methanotrophic bacterial endosymbiont of Bathymodiolus sp.]|nr:hypothetical protein BMETH_2571_0 [methanotrophic bacterial endosymbiont of Bathymodiolus sp.]
MHSFPFLHIGLSGYKKFFLPPYLMGLPEDKCRTPSFVGYS